MFALITYKIGRKFWPKFVRTGLRTQRRSQSTTPTTGSGKLLTTGRTGLSTRRNSLRTGPIAVKSSAFICVLIAKSTQNSLLLHPDGTEHARPLFSISHSPTISLFSVSQYFMGVGCAAQRPTKLTMSSQLVLGEHTSSQISVPLVDRATRPRAIGGKMTKKHIATVKPPKPISKMTPEEKSEFIDGLFNTIKSKVRKNPL